MKDLIIFDVFESRKSTADEDQLCSFNRSYFKNDAKKISHGSSNSYFTYLFFFFKKADPWRE